MKGEATSSGTLTFVGAAAADPDLITVRGAAAIAEADVVCADVGCLASVDERLSPSARSCANVAEAIAAAHSGKHVVRVVDGDPTLVASDEIASALAAGVAVTVVPGVPAALIACARARVALPRVTTTSLHDDAARLEPIELVDLADEASLHRALSFEPPSRSATVIPFPPRRGAQTLVGTVAELASAPGATSFPALLVLGARPMPTGAERPLAGRTVLVTRAREQAGDTLRALRGRGALPLSLPTIVLAPPTDRAPLLDAARHLERYDVVALTSANAVDALFATIAELGGDARALGRARVAAIGPGTTRALARHGVRADLVPAEHRGEALAEAILAMLTGAPTTAARVLLPRAEVARDALPDRLRAAGVQVDVVVAYRSRPPEPEEVAALRATLDARALDVVLFTASSTVDNLCALLDDPPRALAGVAVASIGPITSATCRARGLAVDVEAAPYTIPALLDALEAYFLGKTRPA